MLIPAVYERDNPLHREGSITSAMPDDAAAAGHTRPVTADVVATEKVEARSWRAKIVAGLGDVVLGAVVVAAVTLAPVLLVVALAAGPVSSVARFAAQWVAKIRRPHQR
jgi:hypothetical protein